MKGKWVVTLTIRVIMPDLMGVNNHADSEAKNFHFISFHQTLSMWVMNLLFSSLTVWQLSKWESMILRGAE